MTRILLSISTVLLFPSGVLAQEVVDLPQRDRVLSFDTVPELVLGTLDGPIWAQFQSLTDAAFAADGTLYLLDGSAPKVVAVDRDGSLSHMVGRPGEGPGEYRAPESVDVLTSGNIAVFDSRKRAFLIYDAEGRHLDEVRPNLAEGIPTAPMEPMTDGSLLALPMRMVTTRLGAAMVTGLGSRSVGTSLPLLRIPIGDGEPASVVASFPVPEALDDEASVLRAFVPQPSFGVLGTEVAMTTNSAYAIELLAANGASVRTLRRPLPSRATSRHDRASFLEGLDFRPRSLTPSGASPSRRSPPEPWYYPTISPTTDMRTDGRGSVWVLRSHAEDATLPGRVDVLVGQGAYVGTLPDAFNGLPAAFGPEGLVVFVSAGEYDEPLAMIYRLPQFLRN
jgi:hypothetical protein